MPRIKLILTITVALIAVLTAFYRFDYCKASRSEVVAVDDKLTTHTLQDYRKELVQRMWTLEREFPKTYHQRYDYRQLKEELRLLDIKIKAYYQRG